LSNEASGYVWRCSPFKGATFQVHLAVSDSVNDQNSNEFWMEQGNLAKKARIDRTTANAALRKLLDQGFLELLEEGGGRSRPSRYRFLFPEAQVVFDSRNRHQKTVESRNSSQKQTVVPAPQTVESHSQTVVSGNRHRTQENPREPKEVKALASASRKSRIPDNFQPNESGAEKATRLGLDLGDELERFRNHHGAKGTVMVDWQLAFKTWLDRAPDFRRHPPNAPNGSPPKGRNARNFEAVIQRMGVNDGTSTGTTNNAVPQRGLPERRVEPGAFRALG
jgi:hypothetical protein